MPGTNALETPITLYKKLMLYIKFTADSRYDWISPDKPELSLKDVYAKLCS